MPVKEMENVKVMEWHEGQKTIIEEERAGNPNIVEKYTEQETTTLFRSMRDFARQNPNVYFLGYIRNKFGVTKTTVDYFRRKYKDVKELNCYWEEIKELCETGQFCGAAEGRLNANMAKLNLTNHHGWKEKVEIDQKVEHKMAVTSVEKLQRGFLSKKVEEQAIETTGTEETAG